MMLPHKVEIEAQHPAIPYSHSKTSVLFCPRQHHGFVYKFSPLAVTLSQVGWVIVGREEREFVIETSVFVFSSLPWQYAFYWSHPSLEFHFGVFQWGMIVVNSFWLPSGKWDTQHRIMTADQEGWPYCCSLHKLTCGKTEEWGFSSRNGLIPNGIRLVVLNIKPIVVVAQFSD